MGQFDRVPALNPGAHSRRSASLGSGGANLLTQPANGFEMLDVIAGEAQHEVADPGIDPAPEPSRRAFGRSSIGRLSRPHLGGGTTVVILHERVHPLFAARCLVVD